MAQGTCHLSVAIRRFLIVCLLLLIVLRSPAEQIKLDSMKVGSKTFKKVTVLGFNATDVYFTHSKGISNVRIRLLAPELQKRFNYDEAAASAAERQQAADNDEFNKQLVQTIETNTLRAREAARRRELTAEQNAADPISDKSPIGRKLPELKVERWIGGKPETRDHWQFIYVWAPWSHASKKFLPDVNALQPKFFKEITFFGLVSEASTDPESDAGVKAEFPTGIDATEKFIKSLDITSVPQVVLADPKGIVRYLGHPAALTEKRVQELVTRFSE